MSKIVTVPYEEYQTLVRHNELLTKEAESNTVYIKYKNSSFYFSDYYVEKYSGDAKVNDIVNEFVKKQNDSAKIIDDMRSNKATEAAPIPCIDSSEFYKLSGDLLRVSKRNLLERIFNKDFKKK